MNDITASMFIGVNVGYKTDVAISNPQEALSLVNSQLAVLKRSGIADRNEYKTHAGVVIYLSEWGCPEGGEPVAAITTNGDIGSAINIGKSLRKKFDQSTVTVASYKESMGTKTRGFFAETSCSLEDLAIAWQKAAESYYIENNIYITCGMYENGSGRVALCAESNPLYNVDIESWEKAAKKIIASAENELEIEINFKFRDAWFNYFRAPERVNSRGE